MKKKLLLTLAFLSAVIGASASIVYVTKCGVEVTTVGPEAFSSKADADEYYALLDATFCDDEEDHGETPEDNPGNE